jgi:hypothetical protein
MHPAQEVEIMTVFEDLFNDNVTALMDPLFSEPFTAENGTVITAQHTLLRPEEMPEYAGIEDRFVAELRWQVSEFAAPSAEYKFKRNADNGHWVMKRAPEVTGGEVIATVEQIKRSKTGAV